MLLGKLCLPDCPNHLLMEMWHLLLSTMSDSELTTLLAKVQEETSFLVRKLINYFGNSSIELKELGIQKKNSLWNSFERKIYSEPFYKFPKLRC